MRIVVFEVSAFQDFVEWARIDRRLYQQSFLRNLESYTEVGNDFNRSASDSRKALLGCCS
jgi:hypothetical protein